MINLRQNKGFALTFALIFLFLIVSFMAVYILAVANGLAEANRLANQKRAYYIADAGLADAYERITQAGITTVASSTCTNASLPATCSVPYIPSATTDNGVYSVGNGAGSYIVSVVYSNVPRSNYTITATGTYGKSSRTLQLKIIGAAISKYAYWSQTEINPQYGQLWWISGMLTTGPVQTDGTLNIFGNPVFNGKVTEVNGDGGTTPNYYYGTGTDPTALTSDPSYIFPDGITNKAPAVNLPPQQTLNSIQTVASDGSGMVLTGASTVIFNATGTITVTGTVKNAKGVVTQTYNNTTMSPPSNGVIYVQSNSGKQDGNVTVQGTVNGQLTVASDQNIFVSGSVQYNSDPRTNPASTDMVGLVANDNITVIEASAPTKLEMSAVLVALQGSFDVDQWSVYRGNATTAVMDQFGSLINYYSGATGEMDMSGNLLGGWNQIQAYDTRLATVAPPGFPPYVNNAGNGVYSKVSISEL